MLLQFSRMNIAKSQSLRSVLRFSSNQVHRLHFANNTRVSSALVGRRWYSKAGKTQSLIQSQAPLVDILGTLDNKESSESSTDPNRTVLYQGHKPWKFRGLTSLAFVQSIYWSYIAYESAERVFLGKPSAFESSSDSLVVMVFTHPVWGVVGAGLSVAMVAAAHFYATHNISQLSLVKTSRGDQVELLFHSMFGKPTQGVTVKPEDIRVPAVTTGALSGNAIPLEVSGFKARVMIDSAGKYAPQLSVYKQVEEEETNPESAEREVDNEETFYRLIQYLGIPSVRAKVSAQNKTSTESSAVADSDFYATIESVTETKGSVLQRKLGRKARRHQKH